MHALTIWAFVGGEEQNPMTCNREDFTRSASRIVGGMMRTIGGRRDHSKGSVQIGHRFVKVICAEKRNHWLTGLLLTLQEEIEPVC
jgi:hypothetical protein